MASLPRARFGPTHGVSRRAFPKSSALAVSLLALPPIAAPILAAALSRARHPCALEFAAVDSDGDGRIDEQEMLAALRRPPARSGGHGWQGGRP